MYHLKEENTRPKRDIHSLKTKNSVLTRRSFNSRLLIRRKNDLIATLKG